MNKSTLAAAVITVLTMSSVFCCVVHPAEPNRAPALPQAPSLSVSGDNTTLACPCGVPDCPCGCREGYPCTCGSNKTKTKVSTAPKHGDKDGEWTYDAAKDEWWRWTPAPRYSNTSTLNTSYSAGSCTNGSCGAGTSSYPYTPSYSYAPSYGSIGSCGPNGCGVPMSSFRGYAVQQPSYGRSYSYSAPVRSFGGMSSGYGGGYSAPMNYGGYGSFNSGFSGGGRSFGGGMSFGGSMGSTSGSCSGGG